MKEKGIWKEEIVELQKALDRVKLRIFCIGYISGAIVTLIFVLIGRLIVK